MQTNHRNLLPLPLMVLLFIASAGLLGASEPTATPAPELDTLFRQESGWTGADGSFSIPLSPDTTLWLFGDTWVGEIKDGKRTNTTLINNSVALQHGSERPQFFYGTKLTGKPAAFITPKDRRGYFWPFHGVRTKDGLYLFLQQVENVPGKAGGAFNFRMTGTWLGHVLNPDDPPPDWKITQQKLPFAKFTPQGDLLLGGSVMRDGDYLYIYGVDSRAIAGKKQSSLVVARVREQHLGDLKQWRFFANGKWASDSGKLSPLCPDFPTEFSISYLPAAKKYAAVYMGGPISGKIRLRLASSPTGPWEEPRLIYECPEQAWPEKVFCYSAKAHPELATSPDELIITYAANSWELANVLNDARLYWPRFVRLKFDPAP
ncbi:MAG: hypothetical protein JWR69_4767 [Pedosphaera sp.]|nr:hypothetical protein [Pedosphaera sp.]